MSITRQSSVTAIAVINKKRRQPDLHRRIAVLQTAALLLGYAALIDLLRTTMCYEYSYSKREAGDGI
jgi:hypothetical protein